MANFTIDFKDLVLEVLIGQGNFGEVWKGTYLRTPVAIKRLLFVEEEAMRKYIEREIATLTTLRHPHIVQLLGVSLTDDDIYIVMNYVEGGTLRNRLKNKRLNIPWRQRLSWAREIALAMNYLHHENKMHRDLKSANLLLTSELKIKVCDFGLARDDDPEDEEGSFKTVVGTNEWMAPEVMMQQAYSKSADVFSYGMVLWELMTRSKPLERTAKELFHFIQSKWESHLPKDVPPQLWQLMCDCVNMDPSARPKFSEILDRLEQIEIPEDRPPPPLSGSTSNTATAAITTSATPTATTTATATTSTPASSPSASPDVVNGKSKTAKKKKKKGKKKFEGNLRQSRSMIADDTRVNVTVDKVIQPSLTSRATHSCTMTCSIPRKAYWSPGSDIEIQITISKSTFRVAPWISVSLQAVEFAEPNSKTSSGAIKEKKKKSKVISISSNKYKPEGFPLKDGRDFKGKVVFTLPSHMQSTDGPVAVSSSSSNSRSNSGSGSELEAVEDGNEVPASSTYHAFASSSSASSSSSSPSRKDSFSSSGGLQYHLEVELPVKVRLWKMPLIAKIPLKVSNKKTTV